MNDHAIPCAPRTITIPAGEDGEVRSGTVTLRPRLDTTAVHASLDDAAFRVVALIVYDVQEMEGDVPEYVEIARGDGVAVRAGQVVVVQVETAPRPAGVSATMLRIRGDGWPELAVPVLVGEVCTVALDGRYELTQGGAVDVPVRIETGGGEATTVRYSLIGGDDGIALEPVRALARPGVDTLAALRFTASAKARTGATTVRVLATAFGGMHCEELTLRISVESVRRGTGAKKKARPRAMALAAAPARKRRR